jgi:hypothetical protein
MGPRLDLSLRRHRLPPGDVEKEAMKVAQVGKKKVNFRILWFVESSCVYWHTALFFCSLTYLLVPPSITKAQIPDAAMSMCLKHLPRASCAVMIELNHISDTSCARAACSPLNGVMLPT